MKLQLSFLVLIVAFGYVIDSANGKSVESHGEEKTSRSQFVTANCPSATVQDKANGGLITYYGAKKRAQNTYCTFLISGPYGTTTTHLDVYMENAGGQMFPNCKDGGRLSIYSGSDDTGRQILSVCDALPMTSYDVRGRQIWVTFEKDAIGDNFVVQFRFLSSRSQEEEKNDQADIVDKYEKLVEAEIDEDKEKNGQADIADKYEKLVEDKIGEDEEKNDQADIVDKYEKLVEEKIGEYEDKNGEADIVDKFQKLVDKIREKEEKEKKSEGHHHSAKIHEKRVHH